MIHPKKFFLIALAAVLVIAGVCPAQDRISIICENDFAPYGYQSKKGTAAGFSTDVILAAYEEVGVAVDFQVLPYRRGMYLLERGLALACYNTNNDQRNLELHDFAAEPLFLGDMVIWARSDFSGAMTIARLIEQGKVIGTTNGYNYDAPGVDFDYNQDIPKDVANSVTLTLLKLQRGRYDFAAAERRVAQLAMASEPELSAGKIKIVGSIAQPGLFLTFSRSYPESEKYRQLFDRGFRMIRENGTYQRIVEKWDGLVAEGKLP